MAELKTDYNQLPDDLKAYVDASNALNDVGTQANSRTQGMDVSGASMEAIKGSQQAFTNVAGKTIENVVDTQQSNVQTIMDTMQDAEAQVQTKAAEASSSDEDIHL